MSLYLDRLNIFRPSNLYIEEYRGEYVANNRMISIRMTKQEYTHPHKGKRYWRWRVNAVSKKIMGIKKTGRYEIVGNVVRLYEG